MHVPGHLAVALVQHLLIPQEKRQADPVIKPLLLASLFPDAVDKPIGYIFHVMPNGRHFAHNIFSLIGSSLMVSLVWGKAVGNAWFLGYLGHLLVDGNDLVPWFFPARRYSFKPGRLRFDRDQLAKETIFLLLVLIVHRLTR